MREMEGGQGHLSAWSRQLGHVCGRTTTCDRLAIRQFLGRGPTKKWRNSLNLPRDRRLRLKNLRRGKATRCRMRPTVTARSKQFRVERVVPRARAGSWFGL